MNQTATLDLSWGKKIKSTVGLLTNYFSLSDTQFNSLSGTVGHKLLLDCFS
jgi:hypothetical protein